MDVDVNFKQEDGTQHSFDQGQTGQTNGVQLEEDTKSDTSFDPLFDDPDVDGLDDASEADFKVPTAPQLSMPQATSQPSVAASQPQRQQLGAGAAAPAPKNAPPVLDPLSFTMFSPDVLMTASIDGQVMLWDRRVNTPGRGVGRLWMSEKTPPWCVSVSRVPMSIMTAEL